MCVRSSAPVPKDSGDACVKRPLITCFSFLNGPAWLELPSLHTAYLLAFSQSRSGRAIPLSVILAARHQVHGRTFWALLELARKQQGARFEICEYLRLCKPRINK